MLLLASKICITWCLPLSTWKGMRDSESGRVAVFSCVSSRVLDKWWKSYHFGDTMSRETSASIHVSHTSQELLPGIVYGFQQRVCLSRHWRMRLFERWASWAEMPGELSGSDNAKPSPKQELKWGLLAAGTVPNIFPLSFPVGPLVHHDESRD